MFVMFGPAATTSLSLSLSLLKCFRGKMIPAELEKLVIKHKEEGHLPFFVNCTTGTTVYGAYDPISEIAGRFQSLLMFFMTVHKTQTWRYSSQILWTKFEFHSSRS